jgi:serine protease
MGLRSVALAAAVVLLTTFMTHPALAQAVAEPGGTGRLIIGLRPTATVDTNGLRQAQSATQKMAQSASERTRRLAERSGLPLSGTRDLGNGMVGMTLTTRLSGPSLDDTLAALRADPDVAFAEVDQRRFARAVPNDPLYTSQWYLQGVETAATNFAAAWDTTTGDAATVVAVLDTGVRFDHPDLAGRAPPGYDFVSGESATSFVSANDGDGWDTDASDPGDWVSSADSASGPLKGCTVDASSWHGTRVSAMLGAATNNATGMAGGTWHGDVLPVRVLGKCGGYDSDIIVGMRWAAGFAVDGVPPNPTPAKILNLSLGGTGKCSAAYQIVMTELTAADVLVVASAGNDSGPVGSPANCPGVLAVAGLRHVGTKVGYSSFGPEVGIAAPAGNCPSTPLLCEYSLVTATNAGLTEPTTSTYTDETDANSNIGTSFSAPIVSAVAALMYAVNPELSTSDFIERIKAGASSFPAAQAGLPTCPNLDSATGQCNCTTATCGAGIVNAPGAIAAALLPMARIVTPGGTGAGQDVVLNGSTSRAAPNRTITSYAWTAVSGNPIFVGATNNPVATVEVPTSGKVTVRLAVTDDVNGTDAQDVTLGKNSGGGGAIHPLMLVALGLLLGRRRR